MGKIMPREDMLEAVRLVNEHGSVAAAARATGMSWDMIHGRYRRAREHGLHLGAGVEAGMAATGITNANTVTGGWVKTQEKDGYGRTYSFHVSNKAPAQTPEDVATALWELMQGRKPPKPPAASKLIRPGARRKAFIPINDLHAGGYSWSAETGYGDWDTDIATARLVDWISRLLHKLPDCDEVILFWNGDTFHTNGRDPLTPESKHILDSDGRFPRIVDRTILAATVVVDLAAQLQKHVRIVVKPGNHDRDSYLHLLMALKWRYKDWPNVTVEEDHSPYWAHEFGRVMLFGHHGDRVKPEDLVMKMAADHPEVWGRTRHRTVWTAHKHQKEMKTFRGATWEQASCITDPDAYGAYWGNHAQMQAVVYDYEQGEVERYTVRPDNRP